MLTTEQAADPWPRLTDLRSRARKDEAARVLLGAALRDFHEAGWSYKRLGEGIGVSYESVRLAILGVPDDVPGSGIEVPPPPRSLSVIPIHDLDPGIATVLRARLATAVEADQDVRTGSGIKPAVADYFAALHRAVEAGWDAYSIARAIGSHPKAVFKFVAYQERHGEGNAPSLPAAPHRAEPTLFRARRPSLPLVVIPDDAVQELHSLEASAFGTTVTPVATNRYLALLGAWYLLGANRQELERATGQGWEKLRKRLARAGFMSGTVQSVRREPSA